ncbi:MAG TPA: hypothetical protein VFR27_03630 [Mycobacterium sp.]|nr:hypothetical protein [Mycobacterium sp.]
MATVAEAYPAPFLEYHWCPGQQWNPGWGPNWDQNSCHDDHYYDGEPRDQGHWHGQGGFDPGWQGPGGQGPGGQH